MKKRPTGIRRMGRPLLGSEPLDERLTVMVSASMMRKLEARSGGHLSEYVRKALGKALTGPFGRSKRGVVRGRGKKPRGVRRYK